MTRRLGWIERLMSLAPLYHGYKRRELLREDDRIVRGHVADVLREASAALQRAAEEAARRLGPRAAMVLQQPGNPIQVLTSLSRRAYTLAGLVEHLEAGYSPGWSRVKVKEEDLAAVLENDNAMIGFSHVVLEASKKILGEVRASGWFDTRLNITVTESLDRLEELAERRRRLLHGGSGLSGGSSPSSTPQAGG